MKLRRRTFFGIIILTTLVAMVFPIPAQAAPSVASVSPNLIVNDSLHEITVHGSGFVDGAQITVGSTAVTSTFIAADTLKAIIPAGFPANVYTVMVTNPDASISSLPAGLTVVAPTPTPSVFSRPQIVIDSYSLSVDSVKYGQDFNLEMSLDNSGSSTAYGVQVAFTSSDLLMLNNGGVIGAGNLGTVGKVNFSQTMTAVTALYGVNRVSVEMNVNYFDDKGTAYSDKFVLFFLVDAIYTGGPASAATATPTGIRHPQLVVMSTSTDIDPLQPGVQFTLSMIVQNVGNVVAKSVTMIIGGGSASGSGSGTPQSGVSGGSGEFTNFAPVGSSNIQSLGDLKSGVTLTATQKLVVNVSTNPGAYPMKVTFSYQDEQGNPINDEQIITLLVYNLPVLDVSFYQSVGILVAGQPNLLPFQVVSLGKRNVVIGKMKVETNGGSLENFEGLVGSLDPGGYFTLDSMLSPFGPGPIDLKITIDYTDDFNQARTITRTMTLDVTEMTVEPVPDLSTPDGGGAISNGSETIWQKIWRFILGLFGLDSGSSLNEPLIESPTDNPIIPAGPAGKG